MTFDVSGSYPVSSENCVFNYVEAPTTKAVINGYAGPGCVGAVVASILGLHIQMAIGSGSIRIQSWLDTSTDPGVPYFHIFDSGNVDYVCGSSPELSNILTPCPAFTGIGCVGYATGGTAVWTPCSS